MIQTQKEMWTQTASWMNLEDIILSETSKTQEDKSLCDLTHLRYLERSDSETQRRREETGMRS